MSPSGFGPTNLTRTAGGETSPSWSPFLARTPRTLIGTGGAGGAGFLFGQKGDAVTSVVSFDTTTQAARAATRVVSQSAPFNDQGTNLIFSISTTVGLGSVSYVPLNDAGVPGTAVSPSIPVGSTNALVSFNASTGPSLRG